MSTPQEILQGMIDAAPDKSAATQLSIDQVATSIADYQEKQDAMKSGVGDVVASDIESYLIGTKFAASNHHIKKGSNFNQILTSSGSITDWKIYEKISLSDLLYKSETQFECTGDKTLVFTLDLDVGFTIGSTKVYSTILLATYDAGFNKTTVDINDAVLTINLSQVWSFNYAYLAGNDTTIDGFKANWDFAHDYIVRPLGLTGAYGTQDNIAKLNDAKAMLILNKAKVDDSVGVFSQFTS